MHLRRRCQTALSERGEAAACRLPQEAHMYLVKIPEGGSQSKLHEQGFCLLNGLSSPCRIPPIRTIPSLCQAPALFQRQQCSARQFPLPTPVINMLFRPEEKHRLSAEDDIVPPVMGRNRKMNQAGFTLNPAVSDCHFQA
jgi:hypothetical protein